jgi:peptidoglycan/LPS O-acetylase OafA/YrhL
MTDRLRYLPALDGLRALAVAGVLCYHGQLGWAPGGFLGVDLFFVLSGFLITSLLLREWSSSSTISLRAFWARRARRLLPALLLVLFAVVLYAATLAAPDELRTIRGDTLATLGYVANWRFIFSHQSYFQQFAAPSPLKHVWSLAIEEQFYLLWPLLVFAVLRVRKGSPRALAVVSTVLLTASVVAMAVLHQPGHDPSRVYYGTDTRAQSLLVGALLAMLMLRVPGPTRRTTRIALQSAGIVAAAALAYMWATVSDRSDSLYEGGLLLQAVLVAVVIATVVQHKAGLLGALFSFAPLRWIGRISYGLYLWHWPVFVALDPERVGLGGYRLFAVRAAVTFGAATLSYYLVEMPIRRGELNFRVLRRLAPATVAALLAGIVLVTASAPAPPVEASARDLKAPEVLGARAEQPGALAPLRVLLVGDSLANSLAPGFQRLATADNFQLWNAALPGCGLADEGESWLGIWQAQSDHCKPEWRQRWPQHINQFDPDVVVVLVGGHDSTDRLIDGQEYRFDTQAGEDLAKRDIETATDILSARGARVIWLTLPYGRQGWAQQIDAPRSGFNERWVDRWNQYLRAAVEATPYRATVLDLNAVVDPGGTWTDSVNGVQIRMPDLIHFNDAGADLVARWMVPQLMVLGRARQRVVTETVERRVSAAP